MSGYDDLKWAAKWDLALGKDTGLTRSLAQVAAAQQHAYGQGGRRRPGPGT